MQDFINKKILIGICGGVAAYKTAYLVRALTQLGAEVRVVMTASAQKFITPMTLQALSGHDVRCELFDSQAERAMGHIELARWGDFIVIAPATANFIAKMANGLADDLLSTLYLVADIPVIVCPAMNRCMWLHPATQLNCKTLSQRGVVLVGPEAGAQACGEIGFGRLSEVDNIITALRLHEVSNLLNGQHVFITAGPTQEPLDPVRYLSNHSSGKMGYAMANAARMAGATVTLISGPSALTAPPDVDFYSVITAQEMFDAVVTHFKPGMIFIGAAAVADYCIDVVSPQKIKKNTAPTRNLSLKINPDILTWVASMGCASMVVGFAAETVNLIANARNKLKAKNLDMIIANTVGAGIGFNVDDNQVTVLTKTSEIELKSSHKTRLAGNLIAIIANYLQNSAHSSELEIKEHNGTSYSN